jgi:hypothetical protein
MVILFLFQKKTASQRKVTMELISSIWNQIQSSLFPYLEEDPGKLSEKKPEPSKPKRKRGMPKKGMSAPPKEATRIERQKI